MINHYSETFRVSRDECISSIESSLPDLLGTYILVKWIEIVCAGNIKRRLDEKCITVGKIISIEHTGMVKIGEVVEVMTAVKSHEKKIVSFTAEARCNGKIVAKASHERIIIPVKLLKRLA